MNNVPKFTKEQSIIVSGYMMVLCCQIADLHADIERRLGRRVWTHELANKDVVAEIKAAYREDFLELIDRTD